MAETIPPRRIPKTMCKRHHFPATEALPSHLPVTPALFVRYRGHDTRNNLHFSKKGHLVYHLAALGIVNDPATMGQRFYDRHTDDILCLNVQAGTDVVATGQVRRNIGQVWVDIGWVSLDTGQVRLDSG